MGLELLQVTLTDQKRERLEVPKETTKPLHADLTLGPERGVFVYEVLPLTDEEIQIFESQDSGHMIGSTNHGEKLRHSHHEAARLIACGQSSVLVSQVTGLATQTLSALRRSPAFNELIQHYADIRAQEILSITERMKVIALDGLERLHEKVNDEEATPSFVLAATKELLDRTGNGTKHTLQVQGVHHHVLSQLKSRSAESCVVDRASAPQAALSDQRPEMGAIDVESAPLGADFEKAGEVPLGETVREEARKGDQEPLAEGPLRIVG